MAVDGSRIPLNNVAHAKFCNRCLAGLPGSFAEADSSRVAVGFYSLGALDLVQLLNEKTTEEERSGWREWIWEQQVSIPSGSSADAPRIGGFRPGPYMHITHAAPSNVCNGRNNDAHAADEADPPHLIMTYTALLALAMLRDDFAQLDRSGVLGLLRATQQAEGSFTAIPGQGEADLRMVYCAFALSAMLGDWCGVDVPRALAFIKSCITYEGGFGQAPMNEAQGGPTYCALASLALAPEPYRGLAVLSPEERTRAVHWLVHNQRGTEGGFAGRTEKPADACYSFWCGASLKILGASSLVNATSNAAFLLQSQFRYGGIAKAPGEQSDPYHTYLALAALSMYPRPAPLTAGVEAPAPRVLAVLEPLLNATEETATWIRAHVPATR